MIYINNFILPIILPFITTLTAYIAERNSIPGQRIINSKTNKEEYIKRAPILKHFPFFILSHCIWGVTLFIQPEHDREILFYYIIFTIWTLLLISLTHDTTIQLWIRFILTTSTFILLFFLYANALKIINL